MSVMGCFHVTQTMRSSDGREMVETRRIDKPYLTIGRAADNDVRLADLAASLHHATIRHMDVGRIVVQASPDHPFEIDGRRTSDAEIDMRREAMIRIGFHVIVVRRADDDSIAITVSGPREYSGAAVGCGDDRAFALGWVLPGRRLLMLASMAIVFILLLAGPALTDYVMPSKASAERAAN